MWTTNREFNSKSSKVVILKSFFSRKLKASSLTEVMVATVLIVVVFGIAIATLNNIMQSTVSRNTQAIEAELTELRYLYKNNKIKLPYADEIDDWKISILKVKEGMYSVVHFEAVNTLHKKQLLKKEILIENH